MAQNIYGFLFTFLVAFGVAFILTPVAIRIAPKIGAIDIPKDNRRMHSKPIPRFGGMAIFLGTMCSILFFIPLDTRIAGLLIGGTLIFAVGVFDDLKNMSPKVKLLFQVICAGILFFSGVKITFIGLPFGGTDYFYFPGMISSFIVTIIWIVGITNTVNLIDGLDGLAAGVACIASVCLAYTAYINHSPEIAMITLALAGGALGFLPFNFNPAKIFMGDAGSLFLGFMLAGLSVIGPMKGTAAIATVIPMLVLGLPIFDTAFAIIRRFLAGKPIMQADKGHLHHRIMEKGMGQKRTVIILYSISGILGISAILMNQKTFIEACFLLVIAGALVYVFLYQPDKKENEKEKKEGHGGKQNEEN